MSALFSQETEYQRQRQEAKKVYKEHRREKSDMEFANEKHSLLRLLINTAIRERIEK